MEADSLSSLVDFLIDWIMTLKTEDIELVMWVHTDSE